MPGEVPQNQVSEQTAIPMPSAKLAANVSAENPFAVATEHINQLYERHQQYADNAANIAAVNQFEDAAVDALENPKTGVLNQNPGMKAPELADKVIQNLEQKRSAIRESLSNDSQKAAYDRATDENLRMHKRRVFGWEHGQYKAAETENYNAALTNLQNQAPSIYDLPKDIDHPDLDPLKMNIDKQVALIKDNAQANGFAADSEFTKAAIIQASTKTYSSVIDDMLAKENTSGAQQLFDTHKDEIAYPQRDHIERALKTNGLENEALSFSNNLLAHDPKEPDVTMPQWWDKAKSDPRFQKDAQFRDAVLKEGTKYFTMENDSRKAFITENTDTATEAINKDPFTSWRKSMNATDAAKLPFSIQQSLDRYQLSKQNKEQPPEGSEAFWTASTRIAADPARAADFDLPAIRGLVNDKDFQKLHQQILEAIGKNPPGKDYTAHGEIQSIANTQMKLIGIKPEITVGENDPNNARIVSFYNQLTDSVRAEESSGKKLSYERVETLAKQLAAKVHYETKSGTGDAFQFEVPNAEKRIATVGQIDSETRRKFRISLRQQGKQGTDQEVLDSYNDWIMGSYPQGPQKRLYLGGLFSLPPAAETIPSAPRTLQDTAKDIEAQQAAKDTMRHYTDPRYPGTQFSAPK